MLIDTTGGSQLQSETLKIQAEQRDLAIQQANGIDKLVKIAERKPGVVP
jgi:hypothetical protein